MEATKTILLCGVGGQGTILAADLLAAASLEAGLMVKVSEIHGMAQRGGAVTTIVRVGSHVASMVADLGSADVVVAFETTEALRNLSYLKEGGSMIVNDQAIKPLPVLTGLASMPPQAKQTLTQTGALIVPAEQLALQAQNPKSANVALVGALSATLDIPCTIWEHVIETRVPPKTVTANLQAFRLGRTYIESREGN